MEHTAVSRTVPLALYASSSPYCIHAPTDLHSSTSGNYCGPIPVQLAVEVILQTVRAYPGGKSQHPQSEKQPFRSKSDLVIRNSQRQPKMTTTNDTGDLYPLLKSPNCSPGKWEMERCQRGTDRLGNRQLLEASGVLPPCGNRETARRQFLHSQHWIWTPARKPSTQTSTMAPLGLATAVKTGLRRTRNGELLVRMKLTMSVDDPSPILDYPSSRR